MPRRLTKLSETIFIGSMVGAMAVATMAGCGAESQVPPPNDANNMRGILRYYSMAAVGLGRPPTKMEELEATLIGAVDDPTPFFRSTRDGQPYQVVWGQTLSQLPTDTVVVYESRGADGQRMVMQLNGEQRLVSEEEFAKIKFPKNYKPSVN
jgi:hypothetical protein